MSDSSWQEKVGQRVVTVQIIVVALFVGSISFLAVAAALVHLAIVEPNKEIAWTMNLVLILFLVGTFIVRVIALRRLDVQGRRRIAAGQWSLPGKAGEGDMAVFIEQTGDAGRLFVSYQTQTVIAAGLPNGVALFGIIVYLLTQSMVGLAVALLMILVVAWHLPIRSRVVRWIEDQLELIGEERQFRSS